VPSVPSVMLIPLELWEALRYVEYDSVEASGLSSERKASEPYWLADAVIKPPGVVG
jgi:hypothetical protein